MTTTPCPGGAMQSGREKAGKQLAHGEPGGLTKPSVPMDNNDFH
ncbi:hypothetical protein [Stenotrophomonas maltophilia]|nr:hypothetical protein [Stenotrophomonas maltophilia]